MRSRVLLVVVALVASTVSAVATGEEDAIKRALGPGAVQLADGHWRVPLADGSFLLTHGPDWASNHGSTMDVFDEERQPACATDYYQHVLYGRPSNAVNRYSLVKPQIQAAMRRMNAVLNEESLLSGNVPADYKVKCDVEGGIRVDAFTVSGDNSFTNIVNAARGWGFDDGNVDYTIFYDGSNPGVCGTGSVTPDESLSASNLNNSGGDYAVAYVTCWDDETAMHENGHNQGAVQNNAPHSTGSGLHCNDENDVMCYRDGGDRNQTIVNRCNDRIHFDCGNDTYFDSAPEPGEYLETNWNIGSRLNRFIQFGAPIANPPAAAMWFSCSGYTCQFTDKSTDNGTIVSRHWQFWEWASSTEQNPQKTFYTDGTFFVTLTVRDNDGAYGTWTQRLPIPHYGDYDPTAFTLTNSLAKGNRNGTVGRWDYYKIFVPEGRPNLTVTQSGPACFVVACQTDLDLYVRPGDRPALDAYACKSSHVSNNETCVIPAPATGWWYVGVYVAFAPPAFPPPAQQVNLYGANYTVKAQH